MFTMTIRELVQELLLKYSLNDIVDIVQTPNGFIIVKII